MRDAIVAAVSGVDACEDVSAEHLAAITGKFSLREKGITSLRARDFEGLVAVTRLNLSSNELTSLPADVFAGLDALQVLDLWNNTLTTLPVGIFAGLSNLQDLDIEENELVALPAGVFAGLDLLFLGLEANSLGSLVPGVFTGLRARTLDLSHNGLASLPARVFANTDLYELDISVNQLRTLPVSLLEGHPRLSVLWMVSNPGAPFTFTMVPRQVPGTTSIVVEVAEGAPFAMTTTISVTGGSLPAGVTSVTIPLGQTRSEEILVTPVAGEVTRVALGLAPALPEDSSQALGGFSTAVAGPLTLTAPPATNEPPDFHAIETVRNVAENTPTDRAIGSAVTATDSDSDTLTYTLGGPQATFFGIVPGTGQLQTRAALDYEKRSTHTLRVTATDPFGAPAVITVTINVQDVDEPLTVAGTTAVTYLQHGTEAAARYTAADPERSTIIWDLLGPDRDDFLISKGVLRFVSPPDHESPADHNGDNVYHLTIRAFAGNHTSTVDATVTVVARLVTSPPITGPGGGGGGPSGPSPSEVDFEWTVKHDIEELDAGHDTPTGSWSDGQTLWSAENGDGADDALYAYDLKSGERVEDREFELDERNRAPRGVWSDRSTIWVSDSGQNQLFAHDLASGERLPDSDIALAARNRDARGIWSDEVTMWVLDGVKDSLFAYDLATGDLLAEYALDSGNNSPQDVWCDGVTIWVSDPGSSPRSLFAYRLPVPLDTSPEDPLELERVRGEDFTRLSNASNNSPRGIWSDGDVMYVADASDGKVYTYNMPDAIDARLASLTLSGVDIGEFDPAQPDYEGVGGEGVTETVVTAEAMQRRTSVAIAPVDADGDDTNGHQVSLEAADKITITVASADGTRREVYHVQLEIPEVIVALEPGWNSLEWPGTEGASIVEALAEASLSHNVVAVYRLDEAAGRWLGYFPGLEDVPGLNTLTALEQGHTYWVAVTEPVAWRIATREPTESRPASANNP